MQHYPKLRYAVAAFCGRLIANPRLNMVSAYHTPTATIYRKRRYWYAAALIGIARLQPARFRVLGTAAWQVWEPAVYQQLYQQTVTVTNDGALLVPAMPGQTVAAMLAQPIDPEHALAAVAAAIRALAQLHQYSIVLSDGRCARLSHGDATIANVTYDAASDTAFWFDFETVHNPAWPHPWCCADDLRALLCSAIARLGSEHIVAVTKLIGREYPDRQIQQLLREVLLQLRQQPDAWHLAQTQLPYQLHQELCDIAGSAWM
jgi:hypothetical protein